MKKNNSIQTKIIILITSALLTTAMLIGGMAIYETQHLINDETELMLDTLCTGGAVTLDNQLHLIEQSVSTIYNYAQSEMETIDTVCDPLKRDKYIDQVRDIALNVANNTKGALAVYYRFDPELTDDDGTTGFFWSRKNTYGKFEYEMPTDISKYEAGDVERVGWFYLPAKEKSPMWMSPYYNKNIGIEMISYVVPVFHNNTLVGVVGMDIDFSVFLDMSNHSSIYEGGTQLVDMDNGVVYYAGTYDNELLRVKKDRIPSKLYEELSVEKDERRIIKDYRFDGVKYIVTYQTLRNGMKYVLFSPLKEINIQRNRMLCSVIFLTVFVLAIFMYITIHMTKKIIHPLRELNAITKVMAQGKLDVELTSYTNDEVGDLTESIKIMAGHLNEYIAEINKLAYKDGLTGVKNKTCYLEFVENLKKEDTEYAVVLFDVNNLKSLNDQYGHEQGDALIKTACAYICKIFAHSPVFRIGGDEFVAILQNNDYLNRDTLLADFETYMSKEHIDIEPFSVLSIAFGIVANSDGEDYDEVFRQADQAMYIKKKEMKNRL